MSDQLRPALQLALVVWFGFLWALIAYAFKLSGGCTFFFGVVIGHIIGTIVRE